jgi:hypothetical protein
MFTNDEMLVPVSLAEKKIREARATHKEELEKFHNDYVGIINTMKENSRIEAVAKIRNSEFGIGQPTPLFCKGIRLFTGDEVTFNSGKKGIITVYESAKDSGARYMVYTNKETAEIVDDKRYEELTRAFLQFEGVVRPDFLTITRHFNTYVDGEEVAKGRNGAEGFTIMMA